MKKFLFWIFFVGFLCVGCENVQLSVENQSSDIKQLSSSYVGKKVSFACWNVQTFFDAKTDGTEYDEFKKSDSWNSGKYCKRLERLCEVMKSLNSDVIVLEEIESISVVQDISNYLVDGKWDKSKNWNYVCFARNKGTSIGCAVFSRYPVKKLLIHNLDIRVQKVKQPSCRPLMQVTINIDEKDLVLFVNHWKSKSGGEIETEIWRDWQEALLGERLVCDFSFSEKNAYVLCGDFNRSVEDFVCNLDGKPECTDANVVLRTFGQGKTDFVCVYSPWFIESGKFTTESGSYFYKSNWERIDNIFSFGSLKISGFMVESEGNLAKEDGSPFKYSIYNGEGYSDHFPLVCNLLL